jgi:hypothetical protein
MTKLNEKNLKGVNMKMLVIFLTFLVSLNLFAVDQVFSGNNSGTSCEIVLDLMNDRASFDGCKTHFAHQPLITKNGIFKVLEGWVNEDESYKCEIELFLKNTKTPSQVSLRTKKNEQIFYTKKLTCADLKLVQ